MASGISGAAQLRNNYGVKVSRATATLPQSTTGNLFSVSGRILLTTITGTVTTAVQAQANNTKLQAANAGATLVADLCAVLDITGLAAGNLLGITGTFANALVAGQSVPQSNELVIAAGFIRLNCAASNTGAISWDVTYVPLDQGAFVAAV